MINKEQVIAEIVTLANANNISIEELTAALSPQELKTNQKDAFTLTRLFSYLGGIFILSGLSGYTALAWGHLNSLSRILITLGPGIICLILAVVSALQHRKENNVTILIVLSAIFQSGGLFVAAQELSTGGGDVRIAALAIFGVLAIEYGATFFKLKRTSLLFFTLYFATSAFISLCLLMDMPYNLIEFICGGSLLALSYSIQGTRFNSMCGFWYFISSITLLWMGFDLIKHTNFELLYIGITCFMLYISTIVRSRSILATSAIALFYYIGYLTQQHFLYLMGWPICLILLGFIFFGISNLALKLNKRFIA